MLVTNDIPLRRLLTVAVINYAETLKAEHAAKQSAPIDFKRMKSATHLIDTCRNCTKEVEKGTALDAVRVRCFVLHHGFCFNCPLLILPYIPHEF